eukprot:1092889-Amphidinium_carterae.1
MLLGRARLCFICKFVYLASLSFASSAAWNDVFAHVACGTLESAAAMSPEALLPDVVARSAANPCARSMVVASRGEVEESFFVARGALRSEFHGRGSGGGQT